MAEKTLKVTAAQIEESVERSHNHSNLSTLNNITSSRVSEWDDKADKEHRHNASEIDGLDNLDVDLSNYYTKAQVDNKIATEMDSIDLSSYAKKSEIPNATSDLTNDSNFATQSFVTNKIAEAQLSGGDSVDLSDYATKDELSTKADISAVPTKISQLTNDSNYLTAIPNEYVTETELEAELINKVDKISGKGLSTNDLTNEMVTKINNAATQAYVTNAIAEAQLEGSDVDLSGLATKDELNGKAPLTHSHNISDVSDLQTALNSKVNAVSGKSLVSDTEIARLANVDNYDDSEIRGLIPTKVSQLTNDSNYLTSVPSEYITETELNNRGYATTTEVDQKIAGIGTSGTVNLSEYQKITDDTLSTSNKTITGAINEVNSNLVASLNGKKISDPMTKEEYDAITEKDLDMIYLVDDDEAIIGLPDYSSSDANKVLTVNSSGTALTWVEASSESGNGLTTEQAQQLNVAHQHSQSYHVSMADVNSAINSAIGGIEGGGDVSPYTDLLMDCLGDSITARNVYEGMIKEQLGFSNVLNHGIGGSCICGDNENCFWHDNRINALDENADVVLFTGGSNDWQTSKEMGDIASTDTNTFYGACKTMIRKLIDKYPRKLILGATAIYGYQQALPNQLNAHNLALSDYMSAFKECCNLYNIPIADVFFECGINKYNKDYYFGDTDGTKSDDFLHPNKEYGHPKIANCIVKKLKQLTPVIAYAENDPNTYGNVVVNTTSLTANEGTNNTTFTVYLDGAPSTTQTVSISADNEDVTFSPSSLSFTKTNYSKPQTVKVNIASDGDADSEVANINVSSKKNTQYITLNITDLTTPEPVESVSLSLSSKTLYEGNSFELTATVLPESAANKKVTWSADNSNVTLIPNGLKCRVTATTSGTSVITVTTEDGLKTAVCNITVMSKTVEVGQNMFSGASKIVYRSGRTQSGASYDDSTNTFRFNLESGNMAGIVAPCSPSTSYTFTASNRTGIQEKYGLNIHFYSGEPTYVQHDEEYLIKTETWTLPPSDNTAERTNTLTTPENCQYVGVSTYANSAGEGSVVLTCVQNA